MTEQSLHDRSLAFFSIWYFLLLALGVRNGVFRAGVFLLILGAVLMFLLRLLGNIVDHLPNIAGSSDLIVSARL